jgi:SAM-dependent methyltransferase
MEASTVTGPNFWEENPNAAQDRQWTSDPFIASAIYQRISDGRSAGHWLGWLFSDHFQGRTFDRILSIGCGVGDHELALAQANPDALIDAFDFSAASIEIAKGKAREAGVETINFFVGNFNEIALPKATYDLVLCTGSLHHVREIEYILDQVRQSLTDGGVFIVNEYVGDCYNIYRADQIEVLQEVLDGLPPSLRNIERFPNPTIEQVFARDPTEAVRSKLIPDFLRIYFQRVDERRLGGALMHPLYPFLNLDELQRRPDLHQGFMNSLLVIDRILLKQGQSDFSFFICSNA